MALDHPDTADLSADEAQHPSEADVDAVKTGAAIPGRDLGVPTAEAASRRVSGFTDFPTAIKTIKYYWSRQPIPRWLAGSLWRRIIFANLLGVVGLFLAMLYLSLHHGWLLNAKIDVVKTVSRITAEAIAYRAVNERAVFDTNKLPEKTASPIRRDDAFAALELPIEPHQVAVVLRKLVGPTDLTARVYSSNGTLIIDTDTLFSTGEPAPMTDADSAANATTEPPRLKNTWTRIHYWLINKELKVYRDLGTENGFLYPEVKRAAERGAEQRLLLLTSKGEQVVLMAEPIKRGTRVLGVLVVTTKPGDIDSILWDERWLIIQIAGVALLLSILSAALLARTVAGPMTRLSSAAQLVSENLSARQKLPNFSDRRDEVGQLGRAFVAMTNALYRRIEASEKFAADVSHELKNPLAAARSIGDALDYAKTDEDRQELVQAIQSELKRLNRLINDVSATSRLDAELARQEMSPVDVREVLDNVAGIFTDMLSDDDRSIRHIRPASAPASAFTVNGNDGRLGQIFTNLIDNALSFSPPSAEVTLRIELGTDRVEVVVEDQGPGIPADKLEAIFDRFYSDRPETDTKRGKNSGLGLSISREIVRSHGGEIFAENRYEPDISGKPTGARFRVRLPLRGKILTARN